MAAQNKNTSNLYIIISKSSELRSGPPAVYQLKTKKEKFGTLSRVTVGDKDETKTNKTILLAGETGAGKSTLINALFNHMMGVKFEDEVWFQIMKEGQTSDVIVYQIFGFEDQTLPYSLTIIDTPGFGNTRGMEHDVKTNQQILQLFQSEEVHELHAVSLVMKTNMNRVSDRLKSLLDSLMSLFGKDLEKNIIALITNSNGRPPKNVLQVLEDANIKCSKTEKNQPVYFLFDNCQDEERTEETELSIANAWKITERGMKQFTDFLDQSSPLQLKVMLEVQIEQIRLTACIQNLRDRIKFTELKQREIRETQQALKKNESEIIKNQKFTVDVFEVYKDIEQITDQFCELGYEAAVYCSICEENCHYPGCTMASTPHHCEVMREGKCTSCTNKCPASAHVKHNWRYVIRTRKVQMNEEMMKQKYKQKHTGSLDNFNFLQSLENQTEHLTAEKFQLVDDAYQLFIKLEQIIKRNPVSAYVHLDFLMKKMKEKKDLRKLQELKEINRRMDERTRAELQLRMKNNSPKHEDLFSESVLIESGPPAVYQLVTNKEKFGTLSRVTVGDKDETKTNKTILLVGETGTGKSTLINALFNYTVGVKFEDKVWFQIVEEEEKDEKKRSQTESQTTDVIMYQIFGFEGKTLPYSLTIIDTPGYGNTIKPEEDLMVSQRLFDLFRSEDGVHEVDVVGLVLKASMNRLSDRLVYIFNSVMSLFGKDMETNIVALITHSNGMTPDNALEALKTANIKCAKNRNNQPVYFLFDNCQHKDRTEEMKENIKHADETKRKSKHADEISMTGMKELQTFIEKIKPQKLETTIEVLNGRIRLTACVHNLQERIQLIELKQTKIQQIQEALKKHEEEMNRNVNFVIEYDEPYKEKEPIDGRMWGFVFFEAAVCCTVCKENCHYPGCTMAWKPSHCEVMKKGHCTVCTGKCPASDHVKEKWNYVIKTRRVKKTCEDIKMKYEKSKTASKEAKSLLETLYEEKEKLEADKTRCLEEAYQHVVRLDEIALNVDSVSTHVHLDYLTEKMEKHDTEKYKTLKAAARRLDGAVRSGMRYADTMWKRFRGNPQNSTGSDV